MLNIRVSRTPIEGSPENVENVENGVDNDAANNEPSTVDRERARVRLL